MVVVAIRTQNSLVPSCRFQAISTVPKVIAVDGKVGTDVRIACAGLLVQVCKGD